MIGLINKGVQNQGKGIPQPVPTLGRTNLVGKSIWKRVLWLIGTLGLLIAFKKSGPSFATAKPLADRPLSNLDGHLIQDVTLHANESSLPFFCSSEFSTRTVEGERYRIPKHVVSEFDLFMKERYDLSNNDGFLESALRQRRSVEFVEWLINSPLVFKTKLPADQADHPLMSLVRYGYARYPELFENLLLKSRSSLTQSTLNDIVELLLFAKHPYTKTFEALLNHINDLTWITPVRDSNLLFQSIILGKNELLEMLISKGADLSYVDENGMSALHIATIAGNSLAVELLLKHGAKDTFSEHSAKYYAMLLNRQEVLDKLPFREGEEIPKPYQESSIEHLIKKTPVSLVMSVFDELSIQEKHIKLTRHLFFHVYAAIRKSNTLFEESTIKTIIQNSFFRTEIQKVFDTIELLSLCPEDMQFTCQRLSKKYQEIAKRMQNGEKVQLPMHSRSVDFKQLQQYVELNFIQYAHRGFSGLWMSSKRLEEYGDYAIWFSSDVENYPICSQRFGIGLAGSIEWSQVSQISCPEEEKEKVETLLRSNGLNIPVVSHEEAEFDGSQSSLREAVSFREMNRKITTCPKDYRNKNVLNDNYFVRNFSEFMVNVFAYSMLILSIITIFSPLKNKR